MIDGRTATNDPEETSPPLFDDRASAEAQPVTPIPKGRFTILKEKTQSMFSTGSRAFALVVVLGLATGTLAGMALVRATNPLPQTQAASTEETFQMQNADVGAQGFAATSRAPQVQRPRIRVRRSFNRPRAFRVAVLH